MRNVGLWKPRFHLDQYGIPTGPHMHRILWRAYETPIRQYARGRLVDIGCGDVPYFELCKNLVQEHVCIDWNESPNDESLLDFKFDLNGTLTVLKTGAFDTVLCTDVLEHLHNPFGAFSEMSRVLKNGGHIIMGVPFLYWIHDGPHDYFRYTHFMLRKLCALHGLTVVKLETYGGWPEIVFDLVEKGVAYFNFPLHNFVHSLWTIFGKGLAKLSFVRRMSERSKSTFPMGYVLVAKKNV